MVAKYDEIDTPICKDRICFICRMKLYDSCAECYFDNPHSNVECTLAWGRICQHVMHFHCIARHLRTHASCPLCGKEWEGTFTSLSFFFLCSILRIRNFAMFFFGTALPQKY